MKLNPSEYVTVIRNGVTAHVINTFRQHWNSHAQEFTWVLVEEAVLWFVDADGKPVYRIDDPNKFSNLRLRFGTHPDLAPARPNCVGVAAESGGPWLC